MHATSNKCNGRERQASVTWLMHPFCSALAAYKQQCSAIAASTVEAQLDACSWVLLRVCTLAEHGRMLFIQSNSLNSASILHLLQQHGHTVLTMQLEEPHLCHQGTITVLLVSTGKPKACDGMVQDSVTSGVQEAGQDVTSMH